MARYIDADRLEKEMYHEAFETDSDMQKWDSGCWIRYKLFENCIEEQPTADVVEVVHGEWIYIDGDVGYRQVKCSRCEKEKIFDDEDELDCFCPNCGAKMDGKKVE